MDTSVAAVTPGEGAALVRRAVELNYWSRKRARSLRWSAVNAALLLVLAYDLSCKCPGHTSALHYVELGLAGAAAANLLQHLLALLPRRAPLAVTPAQQRLLGLPDCDKDSTFRVVERSMSASASSSSLSLSALCDSDSSLSLSLSLSPRTPPEPRARAGGAPQRPSPPSPPSPRADRPSTPDQFIDSPQQLSHYLRQYEERQVREGGAVAGGGAGSAGGAAPWAGGGAAPWPTAAPAAHPPLYQLASLDFEGGSGATGSSEDRGAGGGGASGAGGVGVGAGAVGAALLCRLDPAKLTQYIYNMRLWIQLTILERLVAMFDSADEALARLGLAARLGELSAERLRALPAPELRALAPFLEPFADQRYVVARIRELARGGCLSAYKWDGGGAGWAAGGGAPCDSELLLHLYAAYLDTQLPPAGGAPHRPFSGTLLSGPGAVAGAAPPGDGPTIHRTARGGTAPHYVVSWRGATLDPGGGRNNLLVALLLQLAALALGDAPALRRTHLSPAGLNMLWIIGR